MHEELENFERNQVWTVVEPPHDVNIIRTKWYSTSSSLDLVGFSDVDFAGCGIDRKNTYDTCYFLGSSHVCWSAHKQSSVAQSTTEVKYIAASYRYFR
jgi:hypothetical protein